MPRDISPATSLDNLKKEAKRWLKELRAGYEAARARLLAAWREAPAEPNLRDMQYALAREFGLEGWNALRAAVAAKPAPLAERFLEYACPDHHVRGRNAHRIATHAAMRLLDQHPEVARHDIYTAVACGELEHIRKILRKRPELAKARNAARGRDRSGGGGSMDFLENFGTKAWDPLLFLSFTRLAHPPTNDNAVAIARLLLDHGADPNAFFMAGNSSYTPLTGVVGEGEEDRPAHPRRDELARLLLEHGADLYDGQVNYNIHFHGKVLWFLELIYEFALKRGRKADWDDPEWQMLNAGNYGSGARWYLSTAIANNDLRLAEWCLQHGATPNAAPAVDKRFAQTSLYEQAVREGKPEMAELLARYAAVRVAVEFGPEDAFVDACLRLDRAAVERMLAEHPEYLQSTKAIFAAARADRADVTEFLLDLGTPIEVEDEKKQRPLHVAAASSALRVAELLIARGAEIDPYELQWSNTPIDFAVYVDDERMIQLLLPHTRDVWNLAFLGAVDRLREVLREEPRRAKITWQQTPLFWLPEDEDKTIAIAQLFLEHGADANFRSKKDGSTAAEVARKRGMLRLAALLESYAPPSEGAEAERRRQLLADYEETSRALVEAYRSGDEEALARVGRHVNRLVPADELRKLVQHKIARLRETPDAPLAEPEAQLIVAQLGGFDDWNAFLVSIGEAGESPTLPLSHYEQLAADIASVYANDDAAALARITAHYKFAATAEDVRSGVWRRVYAVRQRSGQGKERYLELDEARELVAREAGFPSWPAFTAAIVSGAPSPVPPFVIDEKNNVVRPMRNLAISDWEQIIGVMKERRMTTLEAHGHMTDEVIARIAELDFVTRLDLSGSRQLSDDGLLLLARMPQLEVLELNEYPGGKLTDRGLAVLRHLPRLRKFEMTWQRGISDTGVENLKYCEQLESVGLMGSPTGDGAICALIGKPKLRRFHSGRLVTDDGLALLHEFPLFKTPHEASDDEQVSLLLDGPFTDAAFAGLQDLDGVMELNLFWHKPNLTSDGLRGLAHWRNLRSLGCDGELCDDVAMRHIAAIPSLRALQAQGTIATDDGFVALSTSRTLERLWTRETPNLTGRGFTALSAMPALHTLGVSCKQVDDAALSLLPEFRALRKLTPIDVQDAGFRHVGRCTQLEDLSCMYCRETTDAATEHITGLRIKHYYAGKTLITDRSCESLAHIESLESVELWETVGVSDEGLKSLALLPNLREVSFAGLPKVTLAGTKVFPARVRVDYSPGS